jgi:Ca2+-binding EF-hand superfamily protein/RNA polymerase subunit RPABC4/transcription elongation factor Spt4
MSDAEEKDIPMAECGSCRAIIALDSKECAECGISFSGVSEEALGECGACNALVPLESKSCPECGVYFVADDVLDVLREWFANTGIDANVLFAKFDSDNDGSINAEELKEGLLKLNLADLPPSQIDRLISEVDTDNDGVISLGELVAAINGEELSNDAPSSDSAKDYSENVVDRVMKKFEITDKDAFLLYAKEFDENDNNYLTEAELNKAAESFTNIDEAEVSDEEVSADSDESTTVVEEVSAEETVEDVTEVATDELEDESLSEELTGGSATEELEVVEDNIHVQGDVMESSPEDYLSIFFNAAKEQDMTIRTIFESMDLDDDGVIDGPELQSGINEIAGEYLSPGEIMAIISLVDKDSDGRVNALELVEIIESMEIEIDSDRTKSPMALLIEYMDELDIDPGSFFKKLDANGDGMINRSELIDAFANYSNEDITDESIEELIYMFDDDGNDSIDLLEFIETIETHEEVEHDEAAALSKPIEFPSKWQKKMMSKRWKDVVWPLIHTGFVFFIILWVVNGTLAPFVDGNGGTVPLDTEFGQTMGDDGTLYLNGDAYPCDDSIQIGGCKNSLTPFAGEGGSMSMPAKFYWDGVMFIVLGALGLICSLFIQLSLVPSWRARVKAMRDNESEKVAVKDAIASDNDSEDSADDSVSSDEDEQEKADEDEDVAHDVPEDDGEEVDSDYGDEDEIDIGSYIGLVLEDEEVFGTIIEFDDDEGLVTIEEDGTGDLVTGYQDDMFLED